MPKLTINAHPEKAEVNNSSKKVIATQRFLDEIDMAEPFRSLFDVEARVLDALKVDIAKNGFDLSKPVSVWKRPDGRLILVDGHTRFQAAKALGVASIPTHEALFEDETAAVEYAVNAQKNRRNIADAELMALVALIDKRAEGFRKATLAPRGANGSTGSKSAEITAQKARTSPRTVERIRRVLDNPEIAKRVRSREVSIAKADRLIKEQGSPRQRKPDSSDNGLHKVLVLLRDGAQRHGELYLLGVSETLECLRTGNVITAELYATLTTGLRR